MNPAKPAPRVTTERLREHVEFCWALDFDGTISMLASLDLLDARERIVELEATIANERGMGPAPSDGWFPCGGLLREWTKNYDDGTTARVHADGRWWRGMLGVLPSFIRESGISPGRPANIKAEGPKQLKRDAMRAADAARGTG